MTQCAYVIRVKLADDGERDALYPQLIKLLAVAVAGLRTSPNCLSVLQTTGFVNILTQGQFYYRKLSAKRTYCHSTHLIRDKIESNLSVPGILQGAMRTRSIRAPKQGPQ